MVQQFKHKKSPRACRVRWTQSVPPLVWPSSLSKASTWGSVSRRRHASSSIASIHAILSSAYVICANLYNDSWLHPLHFENILQLLGNILDPSMRDIPFEATESLVWFSMKSFITITLPVWLYPLPLCLRASLAGWCRTVIPPAASPPSTTVSKREYLFSWGMVIEVPCILSTLFTIPCSHRETFCLNPQCDHLAETSMTF